MFFYLSSAFHTIQPHRLSEKLSNMNAHASTITWMLDYFTNRPQYVKVQPGRKSCSNQPALASEQNVVSDVSFGPSLELHRGQFCRRVCFLFIREIVGSSHGDCIITKYADDTVLTGLITDKDDHFRHEIDSFVQ